MAERNTKKDKVILSGDSVISWGVPIGKYTDYLCKATGKKNITDFPGWPFAQTGKTLDEAVEEYLNPWWEKSIEDLMSERRFNHVSDADKAFILAFDKAIGEMGYDFGKFFTSAYSGSAVMIVYGKTDTKSRPVAARVIINNDGIVLRLYLKKIDSHRNYIENAPIHIQDVFTGTDSDCSFCRNPCVPMTYTIEGITKYKCDGRLRFYKPSVEKLPDYMGLLKEFYPGKKSKPAK